MQLDETKPLTIMTLCILRKGKDLLMGLKKIRLGAGFYNGFGGSVQGEETIEECVVRETKEETGLEILEYEKRGVMTFEYIDSLKEVHIYEGISWSGEPTETDQMTPIWLNLNKLPVEKMWPSDKYWHPYFFNREFFEGWLIFDENLEILDYTIVKTD